MASWSSTGAQACTRRKPSHLPLSGYARDELVGMDPIRIVHPSSRQVFQERVKGHEMNAADDRVAAGWCAP